MRLYVVDEASSSAKEHHVVDLMSEDLDDLNDLDDLDEIIAEDSNLRWYLPQFLMINTAECNVEPCNGFADNKYAMMEPSLERISNLAGHFI